MTEESFYLLDNVFASDDRFYAGGQWVNDERERCPSCGVFIQSTEPPVIDIALNRLGRQGFTEHLWNSHSLPIFRQDLFELWRANGLTGFATKPVRVIGWYKQPNKPLPESVPCYFRMVTTSEVRLVEPPAIDGPCPRCGWIRYGFPKVGTHLPNGIRVDPDSWDRSDFFGLRDYVYVFCTRHAAEVTLRAGYNKHISFIRLGDVSRWEEFDFRKWTPKAYADYVETFLIRRAEDL